MKKGLILACFLLLLLPMVATAGGAQESVEAPAVEGDWGSIDWRQFEGESISVLMTSMAVSEIYVEQLKEFETLTGIKVNYELLSDTDRKKKQVVDFNSGTGEYDVSNVGFSNKGEFVQGGYLADLSKFINDSKLTDAEWYNIDDYPADVLASGEIDSGLVFIPYTAEYFLLWYRKDIFDKLGLSVPTNFVELRETAAKLDKARLDGKIKEYAWIERQMPGGGESGWNLFCTGYRFGVPFFDFENMISNVSTPAAKNVLDYYTSLVLDYAPPGSGNWSWPEIAQAFKTEMIAMTTGGNASYAFLEDEAESKVAGKVGYAMPPMAEGGKDPLWVWGWGMNEDSRNKGAAWLFIQWATSPTLMNKIAPQYGCPARSSVYKTADYVKAMPSAEFIDAQQKMMIMGIEPDHILVDAKYGETADIVSTEMSNIIAGIKTVDEAAADADKSLMGIGFTPAK